jgi:hypothetical protein
MQQLTIIKRLWDYGSSVDEEGALIMRGCWHANDVFPKVSRGISVERVFFHQIYILLVSPLNINQI